MDREEIERFFQQEEYGYLPKRPTCVKTQILDTEENAFAGKCDIRNVMLTAQTVKGKISFPFKMCIKKGSKERKTIVCINFRRDIPDKYVPAEEIIDRGYNLVVVCYNDIAVDGAKTNINEQVLRSDFNKEEAPAKISIWAWGVMRICDYLETLDIVDKNNIAVIGHSRLGKTAILCGAFDKRFKFIHANNSGTCGAGLTAVKSEKSESLKDIITKFPYWFCENFKKNGEGNCNLRYDQDALMSLIAPRYLLVASANEDLWANPNAELQGVVKASNGWNELGLKGVVVPQKIEVNEKYYEGNIGYYCREGTHYLSRQDWNNFMDFIEEKADK